MVLPGPKQESCNFLGWALGFPKAEKYARRIKRWTLIKLRKKSFLILKSHNVKRAGIFGFSVRQELKQDSDIDILVEIEDDFSLLDFIGIKQEVEEALVFERGLKYTKYHRRIIENIPDKGFNRTPWYSPQSHNFLKQNHLNYFRFFRQIGSFATFAWTGPPCQRSVQAFVRVWFALNPVEHPNSDSYLNARKNWWRRGSVAGAIQRDQVCIGHGGNQRLILSEFRAKHAANRVRALKRACPHLPSLVVYRKRRKRVKKAFHPILKKLRVQCQSN